MHRVIVLGNSSSGKSTYAKAQVEALGCAHMDLDTVAWQPDSAAPCRRPLAESQTDIRQFIECHRHWVIEGCYADLLAFAAPFSTQMVFLNPGIATCIDNARRRPWEPHKYSTPEAQNANLNMLIDWIRQYEQRNDECAYAAHRALFDAYSGDKQEYHSNPTPATGTAAQ